MKKLIFNDGRSCDVQSIEASGGALHARFILQTSEQLKAFFKDEFACKRLILQENGKETVFENYINLSYIKEESGGIWEVEMVQPEADLETRLSAVEQKTDDTVNALTEAVLELTTVIAAMAETKEVVEDV